MQKASLRNSEKLFMVFQEFLKMKKENSIFEAQIAETDWSLIWFYDRKRSENSKFPLNMCLQQFSVKWRVTFSHNSDQFKCVYRKKCLVIALLRTAASLCQHHARRSIHFQLLKTIRVIVLRYIGVYSFSNIISKTLLNLSAIENKVAKF